MQRRTWAIVTCGLLVISLSASAAGGARTGLGRVLKFTQANPNSTQSINANLSSPSSPFAVNGKTLTANADTVPANHYVRVLQNGVVLGEGQARPDGSFTLMLSAAPASSAALEIKHGVAPFTVGLSRTDTSQSDWQGGTLVNAAATAGGDALLTTQRPTFVRSSSGSKLDGTVAGTDQARYEAGMEGNGIWIEESTTNILTNGSGETLSPTNSALPDGGWGVGGHGPGNTWGASTAEAWHGARSVFVQRLNTDGTTLYDDIQVESPLASFDTTKRVTGSVWLKGVFRGNVRIQYYDATGAYAGSADAISANTETTYTQWTHFVVFGRDPVVTPYPAGTAKAKLIVNQYGLGTVYADGWQVEVRDHATSFTDSTRAGDTVTLPTTGWKKGNWTVELWYKPTSQPVESQFRFFMTLAIDANNRYNMVLNPDGRFYGNVNNGGVEANTYSTADPVLEEGKWYHLVLRGDGSGLRAFINGQPTALPVAYSEPAGVLPAKLYVGGRDGPIGSGSSVAVQQPNGVYDGVRVHSRALSNADVLASYQAGAGVGPDVGTAHWVPFDGNAVKGGWVSAVIDISNQDASSKINWNATVPANSTVAVESSISLDGGTTWARWSPVTIGGALADIRSRSNLGNARLKYRAMFTSSDGVAIPSLQDVQVQVGR